MINFKKLFIVISISCIASTPLQGTPIALDGEAYLDPPGIIFGNDSVDSISGALGLPVKEVGALLYKTEGNEEEGPLAPYYDSNLIAGVSSTGIQITHMGPGFPMIGSPTLLALKSGNEYVLHYISAWDGWMPITVDGFIGSKGKFQGVSHITLYGNTSVPDSGSTALFLGIGFLGMLALREYAECRNSSV